MPLRMAAIVGSTVGILATGCSTAVPPLEPSLPPVERHPWYSRQHHRPDGGFRNLEPSLQRPLWRSIGWIARKLLLPERDHPPTPVAELTSAQLQIRPTSLRATWFGHSTVLLQVDTLAVLTDPVFSKRVGPVRFAGPRRLVRLPLTIEQLPRVDVVLISHNHYDHLDRASVERLIQRFNPLFLVPLGVGPLLRSWGSSRVLELDWWEFVDYAGIRFHCTPARHFSGRSLSDRNRTLWASWYIETAEHRVYFAGDTGYGEHFARIRQLLGAPELVLMPIGAYEPRWFMREVHVDPYEAALAFRDLHGKHLLPIHWGTFDQADEGLQEPPLRLQEAAAQLGIPAAQLHILPVGGILQLGN